MSIPRKLGHLAIRINFLSPEGKTRRHKRVSNPKKHSIPSPTLCRCATLAGPVASHWPGNGKCDATEVVEKTTVGRQIDGDRESPACTRSMRELRSSYLAAARNEMSLSNIYYAQARISHSIQRLFHAVSHCHSSVPLSRAGNRGR